jgi:hypothetical protein
MPEVSDRDREEIERFVSSTVDLLRSVSTEHLHLFPEELRQNISAAWGEFERDFNRTRALETARKIRRDRAIWAGLYGAQLGLKLSVVSYWRRKWNLKVTGKFLKKLLDAIDTVLDSLIAATGLDEALKELKDILSNSVDEED